MKQHICIHFTGGLGHDRCRAGVCYRDVTPEPDAPGSAFRKPCLLWDQSGVKMSAYQADQFARRGTCAQFRTPTADEVAAAEGELKSDEARFRKLLPLAERVKREHNESWRGVETCPECGGKLHLRLNVFGWSTRRKKHLHGKCETPGCYSWAE